MNNFNVWLLLGFSARLSNIRRAAGTGFRWILLGGILALLAGGERVNAAVPTVNGLFYGDGDQHNYVLYNTSIGGSKLWYTFADNRIYVALVVDRSVNDNVFGNRDYTQSAGWGPPHPANRLVDSEYAQFTLTVGSTTFQWNQGYGALVGGVWNSDHTTGAGSGTPPAGYVSSSSFAWNINNYEANVAPNWNMYVNGSGINNWKSPFEVSAPDVAVGLDGYPATGLITYSPYYQWEWPMVYEWSADLSSFGPEPIFVISAQSHHSPAKSGSQDDYFQPPLGSGYLTDYGDLPAPYPTLLTHDGARHYLVSNGARLGTYADPEPDGVPDALARGDDRSGFDDEDGVELLTPLVPGGNAVLRVTAATPGYLSAFIDWTGSGTLGAMTLLSATGPTALTPGTIGDLRLTNGVYELTVAVPAAAAGSMASRFRYTNLAGQGGNTPTGLATTGEVEDYIFTATIGNRVWQDTSKDGIQDAGEPGLAGVNVTLFTSDNVAVATAVTDSQGFYLFEDVLPGAYYVQVDALPGYVFSPSNQGGDAALDSDADAAGIMPVTVLYPGESDLTWDAGLYATGSIGDTIFYDWNGNGMQDPGEGGLPGVTVELYNSANELIASVNTDANGFYLFDNLTAGTYRVEVAAGVPLDYALTSDPDVVLDGRHTVTLAADQIYLAADAVRVTALAFAPNGTLFAILRRDGAPDLLFQIDPLTGRHVEETFGSALDYRVILATSGREDIEALAFHPSGTLFAVAANTGTPGDGDLLVTIPDPAAAAGNVQPAGVANALSPAGLLWVDADESGIYLAGEELFDVRGLSITANGSARIVTGRYGPANFEDSLFNLELGSAQASWTVSPSGGCNYQDLACLDTRLFSAEAQAVTDVFVPAVLEGYLFRDENGDLLRSSGDTTITNAAVRLVVNGVLTATVFTDADGYYRFEDVPPGVVSVLVSRVNTTLIAVPDEEPVASDPTRNRALPDADGEDAVIEYLVTSGYGVLAGNPSETLNFGFSVHPLSAVLDIQLYAMADGRVRIDIWTQDESGSGPIVVLARINGMWTEVGRIPAEDVYGTGSRLYTLYTDKLAVDSAYYIRVIDEAGFIHESFAPLPVTAIRLAALRLSMQQIELEFNTEHGRLYQVQTSTNLREWSTEWVRYPVAKGWSELSRSPFMAGPGDRTQVRVPQNGRSQAYFRIMLVDD